MPLYKCPHMSARCPHKIPSCKDLKSKDCIHIMNTTNSAQIVVSTLSTLETENNLSEESGKRLEAARIFLDNL